MLAAIAGLRRDDPNAREFTATALYRALGVDGTTVVHEVDAAVRTPREVLSTLDRLERRGLVVRARAGRLGLRATKARRYVHRSAGGEG